MQDTGPRPIVVLLLLIGALIALGMVFAAIKIFLLDRPQQVVHEQGSVEVHFCKSENCSKVFIEALQGADAVHCAFYELNHPAIIAALAAADARVLVDEDNAGEVEGLAVEVVPSRGLMHDKFCVVQPGDIVITGSMNPTLNDVERNDNNILIIVSPTLAQRYRQEYEELEARTDRTYQKLPPREVLLNISGTIVEQRFCPQEGCEVALVEQIDAAQREVAFMLFTFTSDAVGSAMYSASRRGAVVHGVVEDRQSDQYSEHVMLAGEGLDVRTDGNRNTMHHKVVIIDNRTVVTGSYNPTAAGTTRNDENMLVIHDRGIALRYAQEFQRVMGEATS